MGSKKYSLMFNSFVVAMLLFAINNANADWHWSDDLSTGIVNDYRSSKSWTSLKSTTEKFNAEFAAGNAAYEEEDFSSAALYFAQAANSGHIKAQVNLAALYIAGEGVDEDLDEAIKWLAIASNQGSITASEALAKLYGTQQYLAYKSGDHLRSVTRVNYELNLPAIYAWGKLSANASSANLAELMLSIEASFQLGKIYNLLQEPPNTERAIKWYTIAARMGHKGASLHLGKIHEDMGDYKSAFKYYNQAARPPLNFLSGLPYDPSVAMAGQNNLAYMYYFGKGGVISKPYAHMWAHIAEKTQEDTPYELTITNPFQSIFISLIEREMNAGEVIKAQSMFRECTRQWKQSDCNDADRSRSFSSDIAWKDQFIKTELESSRQALLRLRNAEEKLEIQEAAVLVKQLEDELRALHPDFDQLRTSDAFHDWADAQPAEIRAWVYENPDNIILAGKAIDLYKYEKSLLNEEEIDTSELPESNNNSSITSKLNTALYYFCFLLLVISVALGSIKALTEKSIKNLMLTIAVPLYGATFYFSKNASNTTFFQSFGKCVDLKGRAGRREYFLFFPIAFALHLPLLALFSSILLAETNHTQSLPDIFLFVFGGAYYFLFGISFLATITLQIRRLQDLNKSSWWTLAILIPIIGQLYLLVISSFNGESEKNKYSSDDIL
jgi:TPR repeat protein/uncharacterized membrane protein YhaH (DUF805 family)